MRHSLRLFVVLAVVGAFSSCGEDPAPAAAAAPAAGGSKKKVDAAPVVAAAAVDYVYNPVNKRDPFRGAFIVDVVRGPTDVPTEGCNEPLCQVNLDELTVVAVVSGDANPLAMVEDRTGTGHIVRRNTRMGKQGGKVTQILRDCLVVTSFISGGADGKPQANKQNMCVKTDTRSAPALDLFKNKEFIP